jgi:predicted GNAT family N-acyltransferase
MFSHTLAPFVPPQFGIKLATERWECEASAALRRHVFCREQTLFANADRDAADAVAQTIVAVDYVMGMTHRVVGTVRIHQADALAEHVTGVDEEASEAPGTWYGSRLAIDPECRSVYGLGSGLVYRAVSTAHARGCRVFLANVQVQNVKFFARLAWEPVRDVALHGRPHVLMRADLAAYPPSCDDTSVAVLYARRAS